MRRTASGGPSVEATARGASGAFPGCSPQPPRAGLMGCRRPGYPAVAGSAGAPYRNVVIIRQDALVRVS